MVSNKMVYIFQQISKKRMPSTSSNQVSTARQWFRASAQKIRSVNANKMFSDRSSVQSKLNVGDIGRMFLFFYDPKHKDTLPYYDQLPLVFPIGFTATGFTGINLHYLPPKLRAILMDALYTTISDTNNDSKTRLEIQYSTLHNAARFKYFSPCVKQYLWTHCRSGFLNIEPSNWDSALMLPLERFKNKTREQVWQDSNNKVL